MIVKQRDLTDCGPTCLLSVIIHYGGFVSIEVLRNNALTDKSGTSAYNLIRCAKKYGLAGHGIKINHIKNLSKDKLPCIAHLNYKNGLNHFVVIYEMSKNHITIMDPCKGKDRVRIEDFEKNFSGIIILLHPYTKIAKFDKPKSILKIFLSLISDNKVKMFATFILSIFVIVISVILNCFLKVGNIIIDKLGNIEILYIAFMSYLCLYVIKNIFDYIKYKLIIKFNKSLSFKLFNGFSKTIFNLPLSFIRTRTSGEIISRFNELTDVVNLLPGIVISVILDLIMSCVTVCFSLHLSYKLTIIVLIFMFFYFTIAYAFKNPTLRMINKNLDENANFNSIVIELINNLKSIKNLSNENNIRKRFDRYCSNALSDNYNLDNYYNKLNFIKNSIYDLTYFFISAYGLYLVYINQITYIDLFTFLMITSYFTESIKNIIDVITKICFIKTSIYKLSEFSVITDSDNSYKDFHPGNITVRNLSYAYNGIDYVIRNYSCLIENKSKVLIKGKSGSGKSTLCQIISKQLTNYDGDIYIDKDNLTDIKSDLVRKNITYIGQKDSLIIDTIENNIKYERNVDENEFRTICKICEIDKIVKNKFNCYDNLISEGADNISGGEKQRIVLARGLINCGKILILDESLSEVNKDMEERIITKIIHYFSNKTIIYVSHKSYKNIFDKTIII